MPLFVRVFGFSFGLDASLGVGFLFLFCLHVWSSRNFRSLIEPRRNTGQGKLLNAVFVLVQFVFYRICHDGEMSVATICSVG